LGNHKTDYFALIHTTKDCNQKEDVSDNKATD